MSHVCRDLDPPFLIRTKDCLSKLYGSRIWANRKSAEATYSARGSRCMRNEPLNGLVARRGYQCRKHYTCARSTIAEENFGNRGIHQGRAQWDQGAGEEEPVGWRSLEGDHRFDSRWDGRAGRSKQSSSVMRAEWDSDGRPRACHKQTQVSLHQPTFPTHRN